MLSAAGRSREAGVGRPQSGGPLSGGEWAAVFVSVAAVVVAGGLLVAMRSVVRTLNTLHVTVDELRTQTVPLVADLHTTVRRANADLERVDTLLDSAESLTATVDSASRLAYLALSNPAVKALALASGTSRAFRRLRRNRER